MNWSFLVLGLSPLVRGNHLLIPSIWVASGSIPARAGKPEQRCRCLHPRRVYPRYVRGNLGLRPLIVVIHGSIPARAGKPQSMTPTVGRNGVYPRSCGETSGLTIDHAENWGLSPLVRGNRFRRRDLFCAHGSIPARAGKPCTSRIVCTCTWVYPRSCGETYSTIRFTDSGMGLSPLVRGNHRIPSRYHVNNGSIPARAGKPIRREVGLCRIRVYPRSCGETISKP